MKVLRGISNFFKNIFTPIGGFFKRKYAGLWTLTVMQLKDKLNFSFKADKKGALTKLILYIVLFVVVTAAISIVFTLMNKLSVFGTFAGVPISVFNLFFIMMTLLSIVSCTAKLTNSLYFSKDNLVLLSYPVKPSIVFLSKLLVFYLLELIKSIIYLIPMFLAYGIVFKFSIWYFPWVILMFFLIALIPVAIASVISIPYMLIKMFLTKRPFLQDMAMLALLIALTAVLFYFINMIPENLHFIMNWNSIYCPALIDFANQFEMWLYPLYCVSALTIGATVENDSPALISKVFTANSGFYLLGLIGSLAILLALAYLLAKPLFYKIAVKPFEYNKKIIFHNFARSKSKIKSSYSDAFVPVDGYELNSRQLIELRIKFEKALNELVKNEEIFKKNKVSTKRILRLLKRQLNMDFMVVNVEEFVEKYKIGYFVETRNEVNHLVLARSIGMTNVECYDPNYLKKQNETKTAFLSALWKDILLDIRTPGSIVSNYTLFIITPIAIALLNKLFASINTSFMGVGLTIMFNILIICLIPLSSNVIFASIYSREGESAYLLKAAPVNYIKMLTTKLVIRGVLVTLSILVTCILYKYYASDFTQKFIKPSMLFIGIACLYIGHLIWSAELDYMNPQDRLYSETGEGNITNPNETISTVLAFVVTAIFTFISYFFIKENIMNAFYKIALVGFVFLAARIALFLLKIKGYRTSRGERGRD